MKEYTRICARIDLDAIEYNLEMMRRRVPSDTKGLCLGLRDRHTG